MKDLQKALVAGAIEAAEIVSTRKAREVEAGVTTYIAGVDGKVDRVATSVTALRAIAVALNEGLSDVSAKVQAQMLTGLDAIRSEAALLREVDLSDRQPVLLEEMTKALDDRVAALSGVVATQLADVASTLTGEHESARADDYTRQAAYFSRLIKEISEETGGKLSDHIDARLLEIDAKLAGTLKGGETAVTLAVEQALQVKEDFATMVEAFEVSGKEERAAQRLWIKEAVKDAAAQSKRAAEESAAQATVAVSQGLRKEVNEKMEGLQERVGEGIAGAVAGFEKGAKDLIENTRATVIEHLKSIPDPEQGPPGPQGAPGVPGVLGRVSTWEHEKTYSKNTCVQHLGGVWQCAALTEDEPGLSVDWVSVTKGIESMWVDDDHRLQVRFSDRSKADLGDVRGPMGPEWEHKGTFDEKAWYTKSDVVIVRGSSYVALKDSPGQCPGEGWQMLAQAKAGPAGKQGKQGKAGDPGPPGAMGPPGISLKWRGAFQLGLTYQANDSCSYNGGVWIALKTTTEPPKADGDNWDPMIRGQSGRGGGGNVASASGSLTIVTLTQAEYDALSPPREDHLYLICG